MLTTCNNCDQRTVINYIGKEYPKCLYLYLDLIQYGCSSDRTRTWIQRQNGIITSVILFYHTALHIYSRDNNLIVTEIQDLIKEIKPTMVNAAAETIRILEPVLKKMKYLSEFGHIGEWSKATSEITNMNIVEADERDIPEIARMLYEDQDIGASYTYEDLLSQMRERLEEGYVRSYVIRKNDKPVAHVGTGAETNDVCTIAYTITSPHYRGRGMAQALYNHACGILQKEGKRIFSVYYPESARSFHHKVGFIDVCECGKLFKNVE